MDETALALARLRAAAKSEKATDATGPSESASKSAKPQTDHAGAGRRMTNAAAPSATTKRQKSGGG